MIKLHCVGVQEIKMTRAPDGGNATGRAVTWRCTQIVDLMKLRSEKHTGNGYINNALMHIMPLKHEMRTFQFKH